MVERACRISGGGVRSLTSFALANLEDKFGAPPRPVCNANARSQSRVTLWSTLWLTMTTQHNKQVAAQLFACFSASDIEGVLALMADDVTWRIPGKPELSPVAGVYDKKRLGRLFNRMLAQLNDGLKMTVTGSVAEGDLVAVEVESSGDLRNGRQ